MSQCRRPVTLGQVLIPLGMSAGPNDVCSAGSEPRRRTPTEALSGSPGSTDFPNTPASQFWSQNSRIIAKPVKESAAGEAAEAPQFPRLDRVFRNISLGGPTALLISVMPSNSGQAAKRPSSSLGHASIQRWPLGFLPLESRKAYGPQD